MIQSVLMLAAAATLAPAKDAAESVPIPAAAGPEASSDADPEAVSDEDIRALVERPLTLDDCVAIALRKNIALRIARSEVHAAEADHSASFAKFLPTLTLGAARDENEEKSVSADFVTETTFRKRWLTGGLAQELPTGAQLSLTRNLGPDFMPRSQGTSRGYTASLTQPLLRGAGPAVALSPIRGSYYTLRAAALDSKTQSRQTVLAVKLAYYDVLRDRELIRVNASALEADSLLVQASEAMVEAKIATRRDILSAQIRLSDDAASLVIAERDYQLSLDRLKDVMGLALELPIAVADSALEERPVTLDEQALIRRALQNNPAIQSAEYAVSRSHLDLAVAKNGQLPQVDLQASFTGTLDSTPDALAESRNNGWLAAISLRYPLLEREAAAAAVRARAVVSQQQDRLTLLQRETVLRVRDIVRSVYSSAEEIRAIRRTIDSAEEKLRFATAMFNLGRASNLDITDAREALLKGRNQYVRKLVDYHGQLALLESLTGEPVGR